MSWMTCETSVKGGQKVISKLMCDKTKCKSNFSGQKNFNDKWIVGAESLKTKRSC